MGGWGKAKTSDLATQAGQGFVHKFRDATGYTVAPLKNETLDKSTTTNCPAPQGDWQNNFKSWIVKEDKFAKTCHLFAAKESSAKGGVQKCVPRGGQPLPSKCRGYENKSSCRANTTCEWQSQTLKGKPLVETTYKPNLKHPLVGDHLDADLSTIPNGKGWTNKLYGAPSGNLVNGKSIIDYWKGVQKDAGAHGPREEFGMDIRR